jgi:hypothetical protein
MWTFRAYVNSSSDEECWTIQFDLQRVVATKVKTNKRRLSHWPSYLDRKIPSCLSSAKVAFFFLMGLWKFQKMISTRLGYKNSGAIKTLMPFCRERGKVAKR